jgi:hypothetical protein
MFNPIYSNVSVHKILFIVYIILEIEGKHFSYILLFIRSKSSNLKTWQKRCSGADRTGLTDDPISNKRSSGHKDNNLVIGHVLLDGRPIVEGRLLKHHC